MSKEQLILIFCLFVTQQLSLAQNKTDSILSADNNRIPLPTIDLNFGFNYGFTDVQLSNEGPTPFRQFGYQLSIYQRVAKFLNVGFQLYTGNLYGEEQREQTNINFRTSLVSPRINAEYNFFPLLKPKANGRQLIRPYVGVGIGAVFFRSKGDLKDENGRAYQFWSNGNLYAETEGSTSVTEATQLTRDFEYETDLRDENLDGFRKYSQTALSVPVNAGIRFQVSKNVGLNLSFAYVMNFTDLIDNVNEESVGTRKGNAGNDNHLFGSLGLSVFLGSTKRGKVAEPKPLELIADDDAKGISKESAATENDNEGQPYKESGNTKSEDSTTSENLAEIETKNSGNDSFEQVTDSPSSEREKDTTDLINVIPTKVNENTGSNENQSSVLPDLAEITNQPPKESTGFMWADLNKDNWISPGEVLHFIDLLFEGEPVRSVQDIQNLIDYYFDQD